MSLFRVSLAGNLPIIPQPPPVPQLPELLPEVMKTPIDYGAQGDNPSFDDGPGIYAGLVAAEANDFVLWLPNRRFYVKTFIPPILITHHHGDQGKPYGLAGPGSLIAQYPQTDRPLLDFRTAPGWLSRALLLQGFTMNGPSSIQSAIQLSTRSYAGGVNGTTTVSSMFNVRMSDIHAEGFNDIFFLEGGIFESHFQNIHGRGCARDVWALGNFGGSVMSQIYMDGIEASFAGRYGLRTYGSFQDLSIQNANFISNNNNAMNLDQGMTMPAVGLTFENSCDTLPYSDSTADIEYRNRLYLIGCKAAGNGASNGARWLVRHNGIATGGQPTIISMCSKITSGGDAGGAGIGRFINAGAYPVRIMDSDCGLRGVSADNLVNWIADFCTGTGMQQLGRVGSYVPTGF